MSSTTDNHFTWIAPIYDLLAQCYSFGQISRSKLSQVAHLKAGERVLYAGAGSAEDAIAAAVLGAQVTVVELSPNMLERAQRKALEAVLRASLTGIAKVLWRTFQREQTQKSRSLTWLLPTTFSMCSILRRCLRCLIDC